MGNQLLGRQAALDQPRRCRRLHHRPLAGAAGVFRPARHDHFVLRRDDVEPLRAIFADHMHRAAAAWTGGIFRFDDDLDPRQMLGQRTAPGTPLFRARLAQRRIGLARGNGLFEIFQSQVELVGIELFRTPAELHPLQLANQVAQSVVLTSELIALFDEPRLLRPLGVALGPRRQHQRTQRDDVVGKDLWAHDRIIACANPVYQRNLQVSQKDAGPLIKPPQDSQPASCGRLIRGAYTRRQSSPSNNAASCAADNRITPSLIAGHLNFAPSSRFQISTKPVPS